VRFLAALHRQRYIGSNDLISTSARYFRSDAVKVMALLTLPVAETSVSPLLAAAFSLRGAGTG